MSSPDPSPTFQLFTSLRYDPLLLTSTPNISSWDPPTTTPSPFYMLPRHRDRLLLAATHFNWPLAVTCISGPHGLSHLLQSLNSSIDTTSPTPLRVKVLLSKTGEMTVESSPVPEVAIENLFPKRLPPPQAVREKDTPKVSSKTGGAMISTTLLGDPPTFNPFICIPDPATTEPSSYSTYKTTSRSLYDSARLRINLTSFTERREVLLISTKEGEIMEGSLTTPFFWRNGSWITPKVGCGGQIGTTRRWAIETGLCEEGIVRVEVLVDGEEIWLGNGVRGYQWGLVKLM
jgi:4-amino-4-deoxychorismate lyase